MTARRPLLAAVAAAALVAAASIGALAAGAASSAADRPTGGGSEVGLATIVASWPSSFSLAGAKSEPLYTEHIQLRRTGDEFRLRIDVVGQGDAAFGTQSGAVRVSADGAVEWTSGCAKAAELCADDPQLRGFLATAALLGLAREDRLPATGTLREVHGADVVCVDDAALHPDAPPALVRLDPCFDPATGAVLAHWSPDSAAFVGATLAPGFVLN